MNLCNILENIIAGGVVALVFGYLFPKWWRYYNRPKLHIIDASSLDGKIKLDRNGDFDSELILVNTGNVPIKEYYWKMLFPSEIVIVNASKTLHETIARYNVYGDLCHNILFPNSSQIVIKIKGKYPVQKKSSDLHLYYEILTEYGRVPSSAENFYGKIGSTTEYTRENLSKLGVIRFE